MNTMVVKFLKRRARGTLSNALWNLTEKITLAFFIETFSYIINCGNQLGSQHRFVEIHIDCHRELHDTVGVW